ncbi:zinc finger MYM-type protein 1-like protein [Tanacetum coccineum]
MLIDIAIKEVKGLISFFEEFRETGFSKAINDAKEIVVEMDIDPVMFKSLKSYDEKSIKLSCSQLEAALKNDERSKIDANELLMELRVLLTILVTVASAERSFSKLKLLKSYLRSYKRVVAKNHVDSVVQGSFSEKRVTWARELMKDKSEQFLLHALIDPNPKSTLAGTENGTSDTLYCLSKSRMRYVRHSHNVVVRSMPVDNQTLYLGRTLICPAQWCLQPIGEGCADIPRKSYVSTKKATIGDKGAVKRSYMREDGILKFSGPTADALRINGDYKLINIIDTDYQLAATPATYYYLNPKNPEAEGSRALYSANVTKATLAT